MTWKVYILHSTLHLICKVREEERVAFNQNTFHKTTKKTQIKCHLLLSARYKLFHYKLIVLLILIFYCFFYNYYHNYYNNNFFFSCTVVATVLQESHTIEGSSPQLKVCRFVPDYPVEVKMNMREREVILAII